MSTAIAKPTIRLFHYTYAHKLGGILRTGGLKPSSGGKNEVNVGADQISKVKQDLGESPVLWFSTNRVFEKTAGKPSYVNGEFMPPNWKKDALSIGLVRFELIRPDGLDVLAFKDLAKVAGISSAEQRKMEKRGRDAGANPSEWFGVIFEEGFCPLEFFSVQQLVPDSGATLQSFSAKWISCTAAEAHAAFVSRGIAIRSV